MNIQASSRNQSNANIIRKHSKMFNKRDWRSLLIAFAAGMLVHSTMYINGLLNPDSIGNGEYSMAGMWELSLGRWGLYFLSIPRGRLNSPTLSAILIVFFIALAGVLLLRLFRVKGSAESALIPTILTCSPFVSMLITYPYCGDAYALSFLLAVIAVYVVDILSSPRIKILTGMLCVTILLSLYQSSLGVVLAVAAGYIMMRLLRSEADLKIIGRDIAYLCLIVILGTALYYVLMQVILQANGISLADYKGASDVNVGGLLLNMADGIRRAYQYFFLFFMGNEVARNPYYAPVIYALLGIVTLIFLVLSLMRIGKKHLYIPIFCLLLVAVYPLLCNIITIAVPNTDIYLLMVGGMMIAIALMLAIINVGSEKKEEEKTETRQLEMHLHKSGVVLAAALIWVYVLSCQTDAGFMQTYKNQSVALTNRIWQQVEARDDYVPGETKILVAGLPHEGNYPNPSLFYGKVNEYARWGYIWGTYGGSINTWHEVFKRFAGVIYPKCSAEQFEAIAATEEFNNMPLYPHRDSVQMLDDVLVIKISDISHWAD